MKQANFTSPIVLRWALLPLALFLMMGSTVAQTLACNDNVQVSVDPTPDGTCTIDLTIDMALEAPDPDADYLIEVLSGVNVLYTGTNSVTFSGASHLGQSLVTRVTDIASGNKCWGSIFIEDKAAPVVNCQDVTIECTQDYNTVVFPTADDNCDPTPDVQLVDQLFLDTDICDDNTVEIERIFIAIDASGNESDPCSQLITINRSDVTFPIDREWECTIYDTYNNVIGATAYTGVNATTGSGFPGNTDGQYCNYAVTNTDEVLDACGETFKIIRTWTVLDWCTGSVITSNSSGDNIQVIKVVDTTPPVISMLPYTVSANVPGAHPQPCTSQDFLPPATVSDACSDWTVRIFTPIGEAIYVNGVDGAAGGIIPAPGLELGIYSILYQVEDACNNITELFVTVEVIDDIAPTAICDEITEVALSSNGLAVVPADVFDDGSYDNCCVDEFLVRRMDGDCNGAFDEFGPDVEFCCSDIANNPIMVVFRVVDCFGNYNDCMVEVNVEDKLPPVGTCPPNATITCEDFLANYAAALDAGDDSVLDAFGDASFFDNCEPLVDYQWDYSINTCQEGTITRSWEVNDPSGNTPFSCSQTIFVEHVSDWVVEFPADIDATCEDGELPEFGEPEIFFDECELIGTAFEDIYYYIVPDACYKVVRTWTVINWCVFDDFGADIYSEDGFSEADLFQDWDGDFDFDDRTFRDGFNSSGTPGIADGYISYDQTIKVLDDEAPVFDVVDENVCIEGSTCDTTVELPVPDVADCSSSISIVVTSDLPGGTGDQYVYNNVGPGTYSALYTVTDECGNTSYDEITITVEDCKKPTPYCVNGLVIEIMQTGMVDIWAEDFDAGSFDNCPGAVQLSFSADVTNTSIIYTCDDLGQQPIQLWVTDAAGNQDFCETFVVIQDNMGACGASVVAGAMETEEGHGVEEVSVEVNGGLFSQVTSNDGAYSFDNLQQGGDYSITPSHDSNASDGVSTYDIVLITQHILGLNQLDSPYKIIAADANNSQTITTLDVVEIRKVVLQIAPSFTNNTSWRFVDADYVFPDASNPFDSSFPELININNLNGEIDNANFVAIKVGDVNGNAATNAMVEAVNRTNGAFQINAEDRQVKAGETFTVDFAADAAAYGFQFTLNFDEALEVVDIVEGIAKTENFGMALLSEGAVTASWNEADARQLNDNLFSVTFTANADMKLSEALSINSRFTSAEAYTTNGQQDVELTFNGNTVAGFDLYQNVPNPFKGETLIGFELPVAGAATLTVNDLSGKVLRVIDGNFNAGYNAITLSSKDLAEGVMYYTLQTTNFTATKKLVIVK
ncbi:MAG: T9SS type A sorting domain-containing protein [Bacteroidota bacterium]